MCGFEPKTKQQVAIEVSVEHCVCSGKVSGGHVPGGPVEFTLKDGQIVGDQLQWTQVFLDGQHVDWQMQCERGFAEDVVETVEKISSGNGALTEAVRYKAGSEGVQSSAVDFATVRASGTWGGAMQGQFTATRQIGQQWQSVEAAKLSAAASPASDEGRHGSRDGASPVVPAGWKKPPPKQVQLAFNGPAQKLHQLFARLDVTGEGAIPFAELVSRLSQDDEGARLFELPVGDDRASIALRLKALLAAFAGLPEAVDTKSPVDEDGLVRLIMGASRPQVGKTSDSLLVSFTEPGPLGMKFATNKLTGAVEIVAIHPATQAAQFASLLQPGLVVQAVNGVSVVGLGYAGTIAAIKAAARPVELGFIRQQEGVTEQATAVRTPEQEAEVVTIERDLLQRRCDQLYAQLRRLRRREELDRRAQHSVDEMELVADDTALEYGDLSFVPGTPPARDRGDSKTPAKAAATAAGGLARLAQTVGGLAKKHSPSRDRDRDSRIGHDERRHGATTDLCVSPASPPVDTATRV